MRPAENPSTGCLVRSEGKDPYTGGLENVLTSLWVCHVRKWMICFHNYCKNNRVKKKSLPLNCLRNNNEPCSWAIFQSDFMQFTVVKGRRKVVVDLFAELKKPGHQQTEHLKTRLIPLYWWWLYSSFPYSCSFIIFILTMFLYLIHILRLLAHNTLHLHLHTLHSHHRFQ